MIYTATISSTGLRVRESRIVADLLLQDLSDADWNEAIVSQNMLQLGKEVAIIRSARILRARIAPLGKILWQMLRDGSHEQATQVAFAGAIKHSRLLGDFMDITIRQQRTLFAKKLESQVWTEYIEGCRGRDPEMPHWTDATVAKLRSVAFSMLAEAQYVKDTRSLELQTVFVDGQLCAQLHEQGENYVLRCMQVME